MIRRASHLALIITLAAAIGCGPEMGRAGAATTDPGVRRIVVGPVRSVLIPGLTQQMLAVAQDERGEPIERATMRWTSSDRDVASITSGGLVTAGVPGSATLRVVSGTVSAAAAVTVRREPVTSASLVEHRDVVTTIFWVGEGADASNEFISNAQSAFDSDWLRHFGGVDAPAPRRGLLPAGFTPLENPFYFALPYSDFGNDGRRKANAERVIPWASSRTWAANESMVKNQWIRVTSRRTGVSCYAQWQDAGPGIYDDFQYVFGTSPPSNPFVLGGLGVSSALDVSPAVRDCLREREDVLRVDWRFVAQADVPAGPWTAVITRRQLSW